jgi:hypothetical protein
MSAFYGLIRMFGIMPRGNGPVPVLTVTTGNGFSGHWLLCPFFLIENPLGDKPTGFGNRATIIFKALLKSVGA